MEDVTIAIAARNEETSIATPLLALREAARDGHVTTLVCANACTDGTASAARSVAALVPGGVTVLETTVTGKPNAWNRLLAAASTPLVAFMDADVVPDPGAIDLLRVRLSGDPTMVAAAARPRPLVMPRSAIARALVLPCGPVGCLVGRLYMVRRARVLKCIRLVGYERMPEDILLEDRWISSVIGFGNWSEVPEATVAYVPPTARETYRIALRQMRGVRQLKREHRQVYRVGFEPAAAGWKRRAWTFLGMPESRSRVLAGYLLRKFIQAAAVIHITLGVRKRGIAGWERAGSTKRLQAMVALDGRGRVAIQRCHGTPTNSTPAARP